MASRGSATTLGEDVYARMRDKILFGECAPGARLRPSELRLEFDVSVGVVREALTRLAEQRLVVAEPNQGFAVAPRSQEHLKDLIETRVLVETFAVRQSVLHGPLQWESDLLGAHHTLERTNVAITTGEPRMNPEWAVAHANFHAQLLAGCGNQVLLDTCASLFDSGELYRTWAGSAVPKRNIAAEHKALTDAALARDADKTADLLHQHIERTRDILLSHWPEG
jgi:DNA-binding GntR family transcriptional regulator